MNELPEDDEAAEERESEARLAKAKRLVWKLAAGVTGFIVLYAVLLPGLAFKNDSLPLAGAAGDTFGPVASILSAIALFAAVWSIYLQREELMATRREMKRQRLAAEAHQAEARRLAAAQERANVVADQANVLARESNELAALAAINGLVNISLGGPKHATQGLEDWYSRFRESSGDDRLDLIVEIERQAKTSADLMITMTYIGLRQRVELMRKSAARERREKQSHSDS
ncbi:MAG: hypothetical protein AAGE52_30415 [Myxococcota bacterium]